MSKTDEVKTGSKEIRMTTTKIEIRSDPEDSTEYIEGYALKFNKLSDRLGYRGWFVEKISPNALDEADLSSVVALFNHDESLILGRTNANLELEIDGIGLKFKITPTKTTYTLDLMENIRSGIINQCSFAFTVSREDESEEWTESDEDGVEYIRSIKKIDKVYDVSMVTTPAYPDTEAVIGVRSKELLDTLKKNETDVKENEERQRIILEAEAYK